MNIAQLQLQVNMFKSHKNWTIRSLGSEESIALFKDDNDFL